MLSDQCQIAPLFLAVAIFIWAQNYLVFPLELKYSKNFQNLEFIWQV